MTDMLDLADRFGIEPVIERFRFAEINRALDAVRANRVRYRAVLTGS